ncbi:hypothetical protein GCM10009613_25220 [Pseudonocardia kongjuensis]|uniref:Uncharacterized protein n=1 Tax=Pseudonocardia kongjuensis TaxID=102227 RepID=A0ABP4IHC7_9PSEU
MVTTARSRHPSWGPAPTGEPERPAAAVFGVSGFGTDAGAALVTRIVDGDTFVVQGSDRVRVLGIDSCETSTPGRVRCDDGRCTGPRARW